MPDPITTGFVLNTLSAAGFLDCLIGHAIGSGADFSFRKGMNVIREQLVATAGEPKNHDLQRAIRRAYLNATLISVDHLMIHKYGDWSFFDKPGKKDLKKVAAYLGAQLKVLDKQKVIRKDALEWDIELLLNPEGKSAQQRLPEVMNDLKSNVLKELEGYPRTVAHDLKLRIHNGWEHNGCPVDWYELVMAFFAEEMKTNTRLSITIQKDYLLKINERLEEPSIDWSSLEPYFEELRTRYKSITEKLDVLLDQVRIISARLDALGADVGIVKDDVSEIKQDVKTILDANSTVIQRHLTGRPFIPPVFLGRDKELTELHELFFQQNHPVVILSGNGGRGKTSLAANYYHQNESAYAHLAWVLQETDLISAMLRIADGMDLKFDPKDAPQRRLEKLLVQLSNLPQPSLLVIDNANVIEDLSRNYGWLGGLSNFHILITSRISEYSNIKVLPIAGLSEKSTISLFQEHYPALQNEQHDTVLAIRSAVGANTLVMELLAKNLKANNRFSQKYSLEQLLTDLQNRGLLGLTHNKAVEIKYQSFEKATPEEVIATMYTLDEDIKVEERKLLMVLALLPPENISFTDLRTLIQTIEQLEDALDPLVQKGWIEYNQIEKELRMSPVIQEVVRNQNLKLEQDGAHLVERLADLLQNDLHLDNYRPARRRARFGENVLRHLTSGSYNAARLLQNTGILYAATGALRDAMECYSRMQKISESLHKEFPDNVGFKNGLAISYSKMGETHAALGNLQEALRFYTDDTSISESLHKEFPDNVGFKNGLAISYSKMGETHAALGNLQEALRFYTDETDLFESLHNKFPDNVGFKNGLAISYSKMGETHAVLGNLQEALRFYTDYTSISESLHKEFPDNVGFKNGLAISYEKMGETHAALGNLQEALRFYTDETDLFESLHKEFPDNVGFKNGLAISYSKMGETHAALGNLQEALRFYTDETDLFESLHNKFPDNVGFKNGLAISYSKMGETHAALGNLQEALRFYTDRMKIGESLHKEFPDNVGFKNGLAISYYKMGAISLTLEKKNATSSFWQHARNLWEELVSQFPAYVEFSRNLKFIKRKLEELDQ